MSYCRWSSDNFKCDIYAYESRSGFEIHVASNRIIGEPPQSDYSLLNNGTASEDQIKEFIRQEIIRGKWLDQCSRKPIGLPFDGESYTLHDIEDFYDKMIELKSIGYYIPEYVFEIIKSEMTEQIP